jgi:transcriptional regulator with XRE-family HTH domain
LPEADDFEGVRRDPDPISRARRALKLLDHYRDLSQELVRIRRDAIEQAHLERGMSYTEVAQALGITKGRISQIRSSAPPRERAFFGIGPVSVGIPQREAVTDRPRPVIAAEDTRTSQFLQELLTDYRFTVGTFEIAPNSRILPDGDLIVICGPISAPVAKSLIAADPTTDFAKARDGRWYIKPKSEKQRLFSPSDEEKRTNADLAYVARHVSDGRVVLHIAGIHAIGSLGAAEYLASNVAELYEQFGDSSFTLVVRSAYDGLRIKKTELVAGPFRWS